jgi:hypothetical protein
MCFLRSARASVGMTQDRTALPSRRFAPIKPAVCTSETVMLPSDAATRLRNGSCEDDAPPEFYDPRCRAQTLGGSTSGLTQD